MINLTERTIFMKYYGIYGSNGCGVYTDYEKALKGLSFLGWSEYNYWASFLKK